MATLTDRTYFPPLEECLAGKKIILYVAPTLTTPKHSYTNRPDLLQLVENSRSRRRGLIIMRSNH